MEELGGWLDGEGRFFPAPEYSHLRVARELRLTGDGPADPWEPANSTWICIKAHGEAVFMPFRYAQAQLDSLFDMLTHAPEGSYRNWLQDSLRLIRRMETGE